MNSSCEEATVSVFLCRIMTHLYQHIVAFAFAVNEVNKNKQILSNTSLGFHLYNGYSTARWIYFASLELLSRQSRFIPNYNCAVENIPISVIGGPTYLFFFHISNILSTYKMPQVRHVIGRKELLSTILKKIRKIW